MEARLARLLLSVLLALSLLAFTGYQGWSYGSDHTVIEYQGKIDKLQLEHATTLANSEHAAREHLQRESVRANKLAADLDAEKLTHARIAVQLKTRSKNVTHEFRSALESPPQPLPRTVFTVGFMRQFNDAIGADSLPEPFAAAAAALPPDKTSAFNALESGLTQQEVLDFLTDYGQQCQGITAQLNHLIDFYEGARDAH